MSKRYTFIRVILAVCVSPCLVHSATFQTHTASTSAWRTILGSVGITPNGQGNPDILIAGVDAPRDIAAQAESRILIVEGLSPAAAELGIFSKSERVLVKQIIDTHAPAMQIFWQRPTEVSVVELPTGFQIFAKEMWKGAPLLAGKRTKRGAILWIATSPGETGFERYPYLLQALADLGWAPTAETTDLWAFFDSSYRVRADPEYLASRWRKSGIGVLHVAAWHNMEPDSVQDEYLSRVIEACHRHAILVYAWLELPHVSEKFWSDHPTWREKTAAGQDAQLDWRKLMNLQNADCRKEIAKEISALLGRFDWDGVNVAELYFESLEGASNPARFTPMNDDVRASFKQTAGFDPKLLFVEGSPYYAIAHPDALHKFLKFRADIVSSMQHEWLDVIDESRKNKPYLDVVLTHIDDRFDTGVRDELGADVARSLPMIKARKSTLIIEDPATLWALGPERYARLAEKYQTLAHDCFDLAVDINIVDRYQDVYPTKKQTGLELLQLVHQAAVSFGHVALYFENSLEKQDLALLPAAASSAQVDSHGLDELDISSKALTRVPWEGPVEVDGKCWPILDGRSVLVPSGTHHLSTGTQRPTLAIKDFNGDVRAAVSQRDRVDVSYISRTRAIAVLAFTPARVEVDNEVYSRPVAADGSILLPSGQHMVSFGR